MPLEGQQIMENLSLKEQLLHTQCIHIPPFQLDPHTRSKVCKEHFRGSLVPRRWTGEFILNKTQQVFQHSAKRLEMRAYPTRANSVSWQHGKVWVRDLEGISGRHLVHHPAFRQLSRQMGVYSVHQAHHWSQRKKDKGIYTHDLF